MDTILTNENIIDFIKTFLIIFGTYFMKIKIIGVTRYCSCKEMITTFLKSSIITFIYLIVKNTSNFIYSILIIIILISITDNKKNNIVFASSIITTIISLSINYIIFVFSIIIEFLIHKILGISNEYIDLAIISIIFGVLINNVMRIRKIRYGLDFVKEKSNNEFFNVLVLNISSVIIFSIIVLTNYELKFSREIGTAFIIFSIIMFITIQKSLQLYYKQKMLIQDLNETKKELSEKTKEVEDLESEILKFNKTSHSISHMQKSLEFKLNKLAMNNEISEENDLRNKIKNLTKDFQNKPIIELTKTEIEEVDDMLEYMQFECIENKIDFELKVNGNIHEMTNNYIDKKDLAILLADHIKDAIIAINHSKSENKNILVRLGKIDGVYGLNIYDSGIEFEIPTLMKLGKAPITTHKGEGGTGIGFMNTFDTLDKTKGSLEIHERGEVSDTDFTKALKFKFDGKHEFKIVSYRYDKIKELDTESELIVEKTL